MTPPSSAVAALCSSSIALAQRGQADGWLVAADVGIAGRFYPGAVPPVNQVLAPRAHPERP